MEAYTSFAQVYDLFMDNVPYSKWIEYIKACLHQNGIKEGTILDLGCGTGKIADALANQGFDTIGVDYSMDMLEIARNSTNENILYLMQDMRELELCGKVNAVCCACNSLNYILEKDELFQVFKKVNQYLEKDGVFIFDINTEYKYEKVMADNTFAENQEESSFIWDNYYDLDEKINEYYLTLFIKGEDGRFDKFEEEHFQKAYSISEIEEMLKEAGFEIVKLSEEYSDKPVQEDSICKFKEENKCQII